MIVWKLNTLLNERKVTSQELAEALNTTTTNISRFRTGKFKSISMEKIEKICVYLECDITDLIEYIPDEKDIEIERKWKIRMEQRKKNNKSNLTTDVYIGRK